MDYLVLLEVHYVYFSHFTLLFCTVLSLVIHYKMFKRVKGREEIELRQKGQKRKGSHLGSSHGIICACHLHTSPARSTASLLPFCTSGTCSPATLNLTRPHQ